VHLLLFCTMTNKCTIISQITTFLHASTLSCHSQGASTAYLAKLRKHFKYSCWQYNVKHLNSKLYYQQLHLKYLCNWARYWLQAPWGWHDIVETCKSVIICEIIVHLSVIVQKKVFCWPYYSAGHPWVIICDCFSEVMFGGRRDQKGEAASAHAIGMHGIVMLVRTQTTCGYLRKRKRIAQNHCHYTETQSLLASVHEKHLHTLETNYEVPNTKYYSHERQVQLLQK